ncbi:MAG: XrtA/PEP-CTERM system histidine kinase PrsK [Steroidobacteraceae bacterium]
MASFGFYSYAVAAAAYLLLTVLLVASWRGRSQGVRLILACVVTSSWAALLAAAEALGGVPTYAVAFAECLRDGTWILVLTGLAASAGVALGLARALTIGWCGTAGYLLVAPALARAGLSVVLPPVALVATGFAFALGGLILLEQLYRNTRADGRYAINFLALALGTLWVYDLFLYSQAQLLRGIDPNAWAARGLVATFAVPLIAVAARRNPQWSLHVYVSRQVVFYTTTLLAVAAYLLFMAFGGYLIRMYGGTWGGAMELVFLVGAGMVLFTLLASANLRRRLRVFLSKHFYRSRYDYRSEWLRLIETLSSTAESTDAQGTAVRAIAQIFGSPGGVLYLRRDADERFEAVSTWPRDSANLEGHRPIPVTDDLPAFMARRQWVVDLDEYDNDPDLYDDLVIPEPFGPGRRHRLVLPLLHGSSLLGFVALEAPPPPFNPNYEDRDLLKTVGRHVATHLAQHEADRKLAESRQFEAYHRLTAFVMHDLKNLAAQLALVVANAERHRRNPEFVDDAIGTIANSTARMQRLIEQLQRRETQGVTQRIALAEVARRAVQRCSSRQPVPVLLPDAADVLVDCDPERLTMAVEHVIRNAQDATPESGSVTLSVAIGGPGGGSGLAGGSGRAAAAPTAAGEGAGATGETSALLRVPHALLSVTDTGSGMTRDFIQERLFKPFDTTKGSKGMGIGAHQVREYVQSIGGRVEVASAPGRGTRFSLLLPLSLG